VGVDLLDDFLSQSMLLQRMAKFQKRGGIGTDSLPRSIFTKLRVA